MVKTLLPKQGAWVRFLVGELRVPTTGQKKKKKDCGEEVLKYSVLLLLLEESPLKRQGSTSSPTPVIKMGFLHPRGYIPGAESQLPNYSLKGLFFPEPLFKGLPGSVENCYCIIFLMKQGVTFCSHRGLGFCGKAANAVEKHLLILCR